MSDKPDEREEIEITENELSAIKEEIKDTKFKMKIKRSPTYTKIFKNIIVGILMLGYMYILIIGYDLIGFSAYYKTIKILQYVLGAIGIIIIEISYQKSNLMLSTHGLEIIMLGLITLIIVNLFAKKYMFISKVEVGCIVFITLYFLIKSIVIRIIDYKKSETKKEES